jgi:hypothetical protein
MQRILERLLTPLVAQTGLVGNPNGAAGGAAAALGPLLWDRANQLYNSAMGLTARDGIARTSPLSAVAGTGSAEA